MGKRLYVGNLSYSTTEADLRDAFVATGHDVAEVKLVLDRDTGRPRGFAFVEMATDAGAQNATPSAVHPCCANCVATKASAT